jgi:hypothetical protein
VHLNAYRNFLVITMRMPYYLRGWGANIRKNLKFIHYVPVDSLPASPGSWMGFPYQGQFNR